MRSFSRSWRSATTLPTTMAAAPSPPSSWAAEMPGRPGITPSHRRTTMKNDPFTTSAESTALAGAGGCARVRGWQPKMQWKEGGLGEESHRHQRCGDERRRAGLDVAGQQDEVEHAVRAVEEHRPDQVEHRPDEREESVAQRGRE